MTAFLNDGYMWQIKSILRAPSNKKVRHSFNVHQTHAYFHT